MPNSLHGSVETLHDELSIETSSTSEYETASAGTSGYWTPTSGAFDYEAPDLPPTPSPPQTPGPWTMPSLDEFPSAPQTPEPRQAAGTEETSSAPGRNWLSRNLLAWYNFCRGKPPAALQTPGFARQVYEEQRLFHGTSKSGALSIRENGFRHDLRTAMTEVHETSHHYLTGDKNIASNFASLHGQNRALIRTLGAHTNQHASFERDTYMSDPTAVRSQADIKPKHILGSKNSRPGADAGVFQRRLRSKGVYVTRRTAGRVLREVQSDDES
jgi:hypothetical protein